MNTFTNIAPFGAITTYAIVKFISNLSDSAIAWNDARVTRNELYKLTDRALDDIGLTRSDISKIF